MEDLPNVASSWERRNIDTRSRLLHRVRAEFRDMPGLRLTCGQAQRLFGIRVDVCERVLASLVEEGTLRRAPDSRYGIAGEVSSRGRVAS